VTKGTTGTRTEIAIGMTGTVGIRIAIEKVTGIRTLTGLAIETETEIAIGIEMSRGIGATEERTKTGTIAIAAGTIKGPNSRTELGPRTGTATAPTIAAVRATAAG
jgi:hypothetical protein